MKKMKTTIQMLAALLIAVIATTACSTDDNIANEPTPATTDTPKTYTMTVTASKGDGNTTTRTLTIDGTGKLNATWTADDKVSVTKDMGGGTSQEYGTLTATNVSADGLTCTLTGELTTAPSVNDVLTLKYNNSGYVSQKGTLDYIATHCDIAEASVTVSTVDSEAKTITTTDANFVNQQAIVKFTLKQPDGTKPVAAEVLTVKYGSTTYKVHPDAALSELYVAIPGGTAKVTLTALSIDNAYTYEKSSVTFENGKYYTIGVKMQEAAATKDLSTLTADYTASDGALLTGTLSGNYKVSIASGATVMLKNVTINGVHVDDNTYKWAGITCAGSATIILAGENTVKGFNRCYPGLYVPTNKTLTIKGSGLLFASSNGNAAGIGGGHTPDNEGIDCGSIRIEGGFITATGGTASPGIGSGSRGTCGDITISGGTVTATGGLCAAGIGSGANGKFASITIGEGISAVIATAGYNNQTGAPLAPIGAGYNDAGSGSVTIDGTTAWTAGTATEHLKWVVSTEKMSYPNSTYTDKDVTRWTIYVEDDDDNSGDSGMPPSMPGEVI